MERTKPKQVKNLILDVDGVFTDGKFHYTSEGKVVKVYGPDDSDGLSLLRDKMNIEMISGDKRGFPITKKRIEDMKFPVHLVSTFERLEWIIERFDPAETVYVGDGIYDALVFRGVGYGIAPANAFPIAKEEADYVCERKGSEGAVAEACLHIMEQFFEPFDLDNLNLKGGSGAWSKGEK
jgi:3-deoxy-D-manno-octulosonate 8-phosphate phosphatase (KDO 8-P phosphatase)